MRDVGRRGSVNGPVILKARVGARHDQGHVRQIDLPYTVEVGGQRPPAHRLEVEIDPLRIRVGGIRVSGGGNGQLSVIDWCGRRCERHKLAVVVKEVGADNGRSGNEVRPVNVTGTLVPSTPLEGKIEVKPGAGGGGGVIVKFADCVVPLAVVKLMPVRPVTAAGAMVNVTVACVGLSTLKFAAVMLAGTLIVVPPGTKLEPVSVTGIEAPCAPLGGLIAVRVRRAETVRWPRLCLRSR